MYKNILVPVDVYETSLADKALQHAQFLAQSASGRIHLLHVIPRFSPELTRGFISDARKMDEYMMNNSKEKLAELVKKINLLPDEVHLHIRSGNIRDEVIKLADELSADVILVGSRNPNIQTHLLGSEAASIVRYAHVPVFVVR
ncbi:universal stress protein [Kluyvera intermedia]|jgi:universal stress protein G|uniref:Universal stress protein n=1 Tax=Kluyvera intermedia TaxID=61648 RepID=A0ABX6DLZ6_KLUIN|nr:universal stress protein [Kluyvera intermedia]QGH29588.1 universal stress protein UspG [Kluyvera intermedia]QGH38570.1 universal stress protein UspG [Kluyvera intermedia]WEJ84956.1 MAG: universal stress protein [Kluyvera intermedia]